MTDLTQCRSYDTSPTRKIERPFTTATTDELRDMARSTGPGKYETYTREMLLALLLNRYPCGYFVELHNYEEHR